MGDEVVLRWNGQHTVLRYASATLSLRLLHVDSDRKVVDVLDFAQLLVRGEGLEPLPDGARLVAAQEVESDDLGVCLPILVFHASTALSPSHSPQQKNLKRRRRDGTADTSSTSRSSSSSLYFFVLTSAAAGSGSTCALQFINRVDLPVQIEATDSQEIAGSSDSSAIDVHVADGPHVAVHSAASNELAVLRLRAQDARFYLWRSGLQLSRATANSSTSRSTPRILRSCVFVGNDASDEPHLLLHVSDAAADVDSTHTSEWLVLRLADSTAALEPCAYVPASSDGAAHVTCCALLPRTTQSWSSKNDDDVLGLWQPVLLPSASARASQAPVRVSPSTLVVTGTTQSTLEVHDCGVLLLSYVLPTPPSTIVHVDGGAERSFFLAVQCSDANRSFFLLSFSASALQPAMTVVHAFSHVGRALVGGFTAQSSAANILLVNDVRHDVVAPELGDDERLERARTRDVVLVNKCVLICKKFASDKHSIHRFRAAGAEASAPRGAKRSRDSRAKDAFAPLRYIERIKFGAAQRTGERLESRDSGEAAHAVSQHQLAHLARSLATRLHNGMGELDRLRLVVADKRDMVRRMNQFVVDAWWRAQLQHAEGVGLAQLLPLRVSVSAESLALQRTGPPRIKMETLVAIGDDDAERVDVSMASAAPSYALTPLVTLESFRVVSFAPATAELRVHVVLRNASARSLFAACVSLASATGSSDLQSSSSVKGAFGPESAQSFAVTTVLSPTFALLRARAPVGVVTIPPHDFVSSQLSPAHERLLWTPREEEKLLLLSSGSNLLRVLDATSPLAHLEPLRLELVRPTFALATLAIRERAEAKYHASELLARLPADVYTMLNPLQEAHVRDLVALLGAIRSEMVVMQQRSVHTPAGRKGVRSDDDSSSATLTTQQQWDLLSAFRQQQHATDFGVAKLLQSLQTRANYHLMWHAH